MSEDNERLRLERDIAKKTAGDLMEELRQIKNQGPLLLEQAGQLRTAREIIRDLVELLCRPLVGKKITAKKKPRAFVDVGRLVEHNQALLNLAADQIRLLSDG